MIVLTHYSQLVERLCTLLGVDIFQQQDDDVLFWDLQLADELSIRFRTEGDSPRHGRDIGTVATALGIPIETVPNEHDPSIKVLTGDASMDSSFTLGICLALCFLTDSQLLVLSQDRNLPLLPRRFVSRTVDRNNPSKLAISCPAQQAEKLAEQAPVIVPSLCEGDGGGEKGKEVTSNKSGTTEEAKLHDPYKLVLPPHLRHFVKRAPPSWCTDHPGRLNIPSKVAGRWIMASFLAEYGSLPNL
ncbi:hypothetical protein LZ31DRAFT_347331 [Colletotrichum somersetense]|nr:hypothetical protein LZ31DRAFT_347331 [Colletotrichum somersetense]